jgi:shikimate dehydrogenase
VLISGATRITGILGGPEQVALSLSPAIHNAAFRDLEMDWVYVGFATLPERLEAVIRGLAACGVRGMNVTMPHKVAALKYMDDLSDEASAIGAVNTIQVLGDRIIGHNTDGRGLVRFLLKDLGATIQGCRTLVIGSGGSARAAVSAIAAAGASEISVISRDQTKAQGLASLADGARFRSASLSDPGTMVQEADVIINATPIGQLREEPVISPESIRPDAVVVDLVYKPPVTALIEAARSRGVVAHSGLGMLLHQACLAFEIWTGVEPPVEAMSAAALRELTGPNGSITAV